MFQKHNDFVLVLQIAGFSSDNGRIPAVAETARESIVLLNPRPARCQLGHQLLRAEAALSIEQDGQSLNYRLRQVRSSDGPHGALKVSSRNSLVRRQEDVDGVANLVDALGSLLKRPVVLKAQFIVLGPKLAQRFAIVLIAASENRLSKLKHAHLFFGRLRTRSFCVLNMHRVTLPSSFRSIS